MQQRWFAIGFVAALAALLIIVGRPAAAQDEGLPSELLDTEWSLVSLETADVTATDMEAKTITVQFDADGSVAGSDGCNRYLGTYSASGDALTIILGPSTLLACPEEVTDFASTFKATLGTMSTFTTPAPGQLELSDGSESTLLFASSVALSPPPALPTTSGEELPIAAGLFFGTGLILGGATMLRRAAL